MEHTAAAIVAKLTGELTDWKRLFCALAIQQGGELRVSALSLASVLSPDAKTTFETYVDKATGDRVFRIVQEESTPCKS